MTQRLPTPQRIGVSPAVLALSVLLPVATTAAVVLALRPAPQAGPAGQGLPDRAGPLEPLTQKDTVAPRDKLTGQVFYPVPFATPPNLKLKASKRVYEIVKQDEL